MPSVRQSTSPTENYGKTPHIKRSILVFTMIVLYLNENESWCTGVIRNGFHLHGGFVLRRGSL